MSNRPFQGLVAQMHDTIDATVGVVDETATIIACSDASRVGTTNEFVSLDMNESGDLFIRDGCTYKPFGARTSSPDYAVFVEGTDENAAKYADEGSEIKVNLDLSGCTGITTIDEKSFFGCSGLTKIDVSNFPHFGEDLIKLGGLVGKSFECWEAKVHIFSSFPLKRWKNHLWKIQAVFQVPPFLMFSEKNVENLSGRRLQQFLGSTFVEHLIKKCGKYHIRKFAFKIQSTIFALQPQKCGKPSHPAIFQL